jgi:thioredoxin reductase
MTKRIVVIGADAAGMSAASQAKRIAGDAVEIVAFERGAYSSYSACGIPYWVAGDVDGPEGLVARSPDAHRRNGIDLRMRTEVEKIDLAAGRVLAHDLAAGRSFWEGFDSLVIATGAVPVRPTLPGVDADGVFGVQTLDDGAALLADLNRAQPRRAVVVGGGYIGVEMAEALVRRGVAVTVVDQAAEPMTTLDPDMGAAVNRAMEDIGIDVRTETAVSGFETGNDHRIRSVLTGDGSIPADIVVLGLGVRPNTALAQDAGLELGDHGGLRTNVQMQVLGYDHICHVSRGGRHGGEQGVPSGDRPDRAARARRHTRRVRIRDRNRAVHHEGRLLPGHPADERQDDRRTLHRTSAGSADRRSGGIGQADRHGCDSAVEPDDGRRDDRPGSRLRSAVRAGMGSDSRGGTAGRRGSAPGRRRPAMTRLSFTR